jgi:acetyl esterase/lipase
MPASASAITFFTEQNFVVVSANYRHSGIQPPKNEIHFPDQIQDIACCAAWVQRNIEKYGGDPNKIIIGGHSAGTQITSLIAYGNNEKNWLEGTEYNGDKLKFIGFIGWGGVYDWNAVNQNHPQIKYYLGSIYGPGKWDVSNPINYVSPGDPPGLFITGDRDDYVNVPNPEDGKYDTCSYRMDKALAKAGIYHQLVIVPGGKHADILILINRKRELQTPVTDFIRKVTR